MPVPLPASDDTNLRPPEAAEVRLISRGVTTAITPSSGLTEVQRLLIAALFPAMTGVAATFGEEPLSPAGLAEALRPRNAEFRSRIVQIMILGALLLRLLRLRSPNVSAPTPASCPSMTACSR